MHQVSLFLKQEKKCNWCKKNKHNSKRKQDYLSYPTDIFIFSCLKKALLNFDILLKMLNFLIFLLE